MKFKIPIRYGFQNLLIWLLIYLVASPFLQVGSHASLLLTGFISLVFFFAVWTIQKYQGYFKLSLILLFLTLTLLWLSTLKIISFPPIIYSVISLSYLSILVFTFGKFVFTSRVVDSSLICAALCLYLLIGIIWGIGYETLEIVYPGSFNGISTDSSISPALIRQKFTYFSFITLTTLGYGDITPKSSRAFALCQTEAIIGQFFMAVLVARLVGIQVSQQFSDKKNER